MEAPERIWSEHRTCTIDASGATRLLAMDRQFERGTEYIRADIHRAELEAVREACAKAIAKLYKRNNTVGYDEGWDDALDIAEQAVETLDLDEILKEARK